MLTVNEMYRKSCPILQISCMSEIQNFQVPIITLFYQGILYDSHMKKVRSNIAGHLIVYITSMLHVCQYQHIEYC